MEIFLECLPCMLRQVLESAYMATDDEYIHELIMVDALEVLSNYKEYSYAPELCESMHKIVKRRTGVEDPYYKVKSNDIKAALKLEPIIKDLDRKSVV